MSPDQAREVLRQCEAPKGVNFHALPSSVVENISDAARTYRYRKPKNANGSRARYFHARLVRLSEKKD
jgi:hypothetical protein